MQDRARARVLTWLATVGIGSSILIMVALSLLRDGWQHPPIVLPAWGPPWDLPTTHVSLGTASVALWIAVAAGTGGVIAGLAAIGHGARPSPRWLLIIAAIVVAVLTVLPPTGSTDAFDYAAYGRIVVLGHSPYLMTPYHLRRVHDALAGSVPVSWQHMVSVYGPLATVEQFLAAKLGGVSAARITFWLKLWNSVAFAVVALVADRLLRADPARRLRAHLLWTLNPLLLWDVIAAGHLDVLAAAAGLLGLLVLRWQPEDQQPSLPRALASGALIGVAADIKANYALFALGVIWALRRRPDLAGRRRLRRTRCRGTRIRLVWRGRGPCRCLPPEPGQRWQLLRRAPGAAVLPRADRRRPRHCRGAAGAAAHARGHPGPSRGAASPGGQHCVAAAVALPVSVVRHDDHLSADLLSGVPARLADPGAGRGRHDHRPPGHSGSPTGPRRRPHPRLQRQRAQPAGAARRGRGPGRAVPVRTLEPS